MTGVNGLDAIQQFSKDRAKAFEVKASTSRGVLRYTKLKREPQVTEFLNPEIEDIGEHLKKYGYISEPKENKLTEAADKARQAVSGYAANNGARKAVEALADAIEQQGKGVV